MRELKFTKTHEWLARDKNDEFTLGITLHAEELLGDLVFIELAAVGTEVKANDEIGVLESVKAAADLYAPVSGVINAVNNEAIATPSLVNSDPEKNGWLIKLKVTQPEEWEQLLTKEEYTNLIAERG